MRPSGQSAGGRDPRIAEVGRLIRRQVVLPDGRVRLPRVVRGAHLGPRGGHNDRVRAEPDASLGSPTADVRGGRGGDDLILWPRRRRPSARRLGDDHISSARGNNRLAGGLRRRGLSGGAGNDRLSDRLESDPLGRAPAGNHLSGGPGNDRITSTGGLYDRVECNLGHDRVTADLPRCEHNGRAPGGPAPTTGAADQAALRGLRCGRRASAKVKSALTVRVAPGQGGGGRPGRLVLGLAAG